MKRWIIALVAVLLVLWALGTSLLFVDATEYVYVTQFGRHVATYDGRTDAGLKFKAPWPVQSALRVDRRLQVFDVPTQELLVRDEDEKTKEQKSLPLTFDVYVCWQLADKTESDDPCDRFVRSFGTLDKAQSFLRSQVISRLKVELSHVPLDALVNTDPKQLQTDAMLRQVRDRRYQRGGDDEQLLNLSERARSVGIETIDIRLRRFNHPVQVREEIFAKIREDRKREANNYRLQGEELAANIRAEGELEARRIRHRAEADKVRTEGDARAEATRILNEATKEAPEFYRIVRLLEGYKRMFGDDKTQLILSLDHPLLALFKELPQMNNHTNPQRKQGNPDTNPQRKQGPNK